MLEEFITFIFEKREKSISILFFSFLYKQNKTTFSPQGFLAYDFLSLTLDLASECGENIKYNLRFKIALPAPFLVILASIYFH